MRRNSRRPGVYHEFSGRQLHSRCDVCRAADSGPRQDVTDVWRGDERRGVRDADGAADRAADADRGRHGDLDGDAESAVAADQSGLGERIGDLVDQRRVGRRVADWGRPSPGAINLSFTGASNTSGPIGVSLTSSSTARRRARSASWTLPWTIRRGDGVDSVYGLGARRRRGDAREYLPGRVRSGSRAGRSELRRHGANLRGVRGIHRRGACRTSRQRSRRSPANTRAGWGFMVLTNMLPDQGNGTYQFIMLCAGPRRPPCCLGRGRCRAPTPARRYPLARLIRRPGRRRRPGRAL